MKASNESKSRRDFLGNVGRGMIAASVGGTIASDLGFSTAFAEEGAAELDTLSFGILEPLVEVMRDTPPDKLQALLVGKLRRGEATLKDMTAAGALANARTFGGEDYDGFHCMFALVPALEMAAELPEQERALPVLKVLYRNTARMQSVRAKNPTDVLRLVNPAELPPNTNVGELIREASRKGDVALADRLIVALAQRSPKEALQALQVVVRDRTNVHSVALTHRAWEVIDLIGEEHAHVLLRQSVHFCTGKNRGYSHGGIDRDLQKALEEHLERFDGKPPGSGKADDTWVAKTGHLIYGSSRVEAAGLVADALAEGIAPETVGEAIALAANEIVLRQTANRTHGDSKGVHASDAVNAWRNIARISTDRNQFASLIVAAYHVGGAGKKVIGPEAPLSGDDDLLDLFREQAEATKPGRVLAEAEEAIRGNDQIRAAAAVLRYSQLKNDNPRPVFNLLLKYAVSEDGRLHAEKYYRTVTEEFASIRPAYRWRELIALARVTASCYGMTRKDKKGGRAPGYLDARKLLNLA